MPALLALGSRWGDSRGWMARMGAETACTAKGHQSVCPHGQPKAGVVGVGAHPCRPPWKLCHWQEKVQPHLWGTSSRRALSKLTGETRFFQRKCMYSSIWSVCCPSLLHPKTWSHSYQEGEWSPSPDLPCDSDVGGECRRKEQQNGDFWALNKYLWDVITQINFLLMLYAQEPVMHISITSPWSWRHQLDGLVWETLLQNPSVYIFPSVAGTGWRGAVLKALFVPVNKLTDSLHLSEVWAFSSPSTCEAYQHHFPF